MSKALLIVAGLAGAVIGAGGVGLGCLVSASEPTGAAADAEAACAVLARAEQGGITANKVGHTRLGAAYQLAFAAAEGDSEFDPLAEPLTKAYRIALRAFDADHPDAVAALAAARQACDDL